MIANLRPTSSLKILVRHKNTYKNLPEESKRMVDRIIRVDHAG